MQTLFTKQLDWPGLGRQAKRVVLAPALNRAPLRPVADRQALRRLEDWLSIGRVTQRPWSKRLPAVGVAGLALTAYAWSAGLNPVDVRWALGLGLVAAILGLHTDSADP